MDTLNRQSYGFAATDLQHWLKHACLPVALIVAMLWLPKPWSIEPPAPHKALQLELLEPTPQKQDIVEPSIIEPPPVEPEIEPVIEPKAEPQPKPELTEPAVNQTEAPPAEPRSQVKPQQKPPTQSAVETAPLPSTQLKATDVMQMLNNRKSIAITPEFEARSTPGKDFHIPKPVVTDWYADVPYLDESVDKPRLEMNFYSAGFQGSIERFFDKITISKTFTTKYGTKIHCAWIGIIAACSWK